MEKTNKPKLSVIIPVYNAERFIERCCVSLFDQTLDNIEYIFVDDSSSDNSVNMIREIAARYPGREPLVKILTHTPNRGVSFSRELGLENATGEFVIHCDSDDWVDLEMYKTMYDTAINEDADEVCCGYIIEYSNGRKFECHVEEKTLCGKVDFNLSPTTGSLVNKLVRLQNLRDANVHFPQDTDWGEDFCVSIAGLLLSRKTIYLHNCFYHYWQNVESITHTITRERCLELLRVVGHVENFLQQIGKIAEYEFELNYLKFQCKSRFLRDKSVRDIPFWQLTFPECHKHIMSYSDSLYFRVASWLVAHQLSWLALPILILRDYKM